MSKKAKVKAGASAAKAKAAKAAKFAKLELSKAKAKIMAVEKKVVSQIKKNPEKAVITAAAVGAAVGIGLIRAMKRIRK